jgi:hypothetical protein
MRGTAPDNGQIGQRIRAYHLKVRGRAVSEDCASFVGTGHHVGVGQQVSVLRRFPVISMAATCGVTVLATLMTVSE